MKRFAVAILVVIILAAIAAAFFVTRSHSMPPAPPAAAQLAPDAYPFYSALSWGVAHAAAEEGFSGYEATSTPVANVTNIAAVAQPFENYYAQKLAALGWQVDNALAAGGPGSDITAYRKGSAYIIVGYQSAFKAGGVNEPAQCPCDISFFVFSSSSTPAQ